MLTIINNECKGHFIEKCAVLKFYRDKHDKQKCIDRLNMIIQDAFQYIKSVDIFIDYNKFIGYHFNFYSFQTSNLKYFLTKYNIKSNIKDKSVFMYINNTVNSHKWLRYCKCREKNVNITF